MTKPEWMRENERKKSIEDSADKCMDCEHFGLPVRETRYRGKERCMVHECEKHPGCMNTRFSLACGDFSRM